MFTIKRKLNVLLFYVQMYAAGSGGVNMSEWSNLSWVEVVKRLNSDAGKGLNYSAIDEIKKEDTDNSLNIKVIEKSAFKYTLAELKKPWIIICLINICVLLFFLDQIAAAILLFLVLSLNLAVPVSKNINNDKDKKELIKLNPSFAHVIREGKIQKLLPEELVRGDIVFVDKGELVPADIRLISASHLKVNEAAITGENFNAEKYETKIEEKELSVLDMKNILFRSSLVVEGEAKGIVLKTEGDTEFGNILKSILNENKGKNLFEYKIYEVIKRFTYLSAFIEIIICLISLILNIGIKTGISIGVTFLVALIPEALMLILEIFNRIITKMESSRGITFKNLSSIEKLSNVNNLFINKMDIISGYMMKVNKIYSDDKWITNDDILFYLGNKNERGLHNNDENIERILTIAALCNDYKTSDRLEGGSVNLLIDKGLKDFAADYKFERNNLEKKQRRIFSIGYDASRRLMTSVNKFEGNYRAYVKGDTEQIIIRCTHIMKNGVEKEITDDDIKLIKSVNMKMALEGDNTIAMAYRSFSYEPRIIENIESHLVFVGLISFENPIKDNMDEFLEDNERLNILSTIFCEDNKLTSIAFGQKNKFIKRVEQVLAGIEIENIDDEALKKTVNNIRIFSNVGWENKLRIIKQYNELHFSSAFISNKLIDLPCLKASDISISSGDRCNPIVKKLSDIWIEENSLQKVIDLIKFSRKIVGTLQKVFSYVFFCSILQCIFVLILSLLNAGKLLYPLNMLWVNIITIPLCCIAIAIQYEEEDNEIKNSIPEKDQLYKIIKIALFALLFYLSALFIGNHYGGQNCSQFIFGVINLSPIMFVHIFTDNFIYKNRITNIILILNFAFQVLVCMFSKNMGISETFFLNASLWQKLVILIIIEYLFTVIVKAYKKI